MVHPSTCQPGQLPILYKVRKVYCVKTSCVLLYFAYYGMHTHTYIHIHWYTHVHIHTIGYQYRSPFSPCTVDSKHMCTHSYVHTLIQVYTHKNVCTHTLFSYTLGIRLTMDPSPSSHKYVLCSTCMHSQISRTYTHTDESTHECMHAHTHAHAYTYNMSSSATSSRSSSSLVKSYQRRHGDFSPLGATWDPWLPSDPAASLHFPPCWCTLGICGNIHYDYWQGRITLYLALLVSWAWTVWGWSDLWILSWLCWQLPLYGS